MTVEADLEHPFFVFGRGWSSPHPDRTLSRYRLPCRQLRVGDVCVSLTHRDLMTMAEEEAEAAERGEEEEEEQVREGGRLACGAFLYPKITFAL